MYVLITSSKLCSFILSAISLSKTGGQYSLYFNLITAIILPCEIAHKINQQSSNKFFLSWARAFFAPYFCDYTCVWRGTFLLGNKGTIKEPEPVVALIL